MFSESWPSSVAGGDSLQERIVTHGSPALLFSNCFASNQRSHLCKEPWKRVNVAFLRNENGSERSKFAAFHTPILAPEVIAREIPFNLAAAL